MTEQPILLRLDGGNDAIENIEAVLAHNEQDAERAAVDFLIKWNPRKEDPVEWLDYAEKHALWSEPRPGKRVALFEVMETRHWKDTEYRVRRVIRVIELTIDKHGQGAVGP